MTSGGERRLLGRAVAGSEMDCRVKPGNDSGGLATTVRPLPTVARGSSRRIYASSAQHLRAALGIAGRDRVMNLIAALKVVYHRQLRADEIVIPYGIDQTVANVRPLFILVAPLLSPAVLVDKGSDCLIPPHAQLFPQFRFLFALVALLNFPSFGYAPPLPVTPTQH